MIEFRKVSKTFTDNNTHAVRELSMTIEDGEFVFIVGASGAGKSTVLKLIMREQLPTKGDVVIDGQYINRLKRSKVPYLRRKVGMVYQDFRLIDKMTVFENVAFALRVTGKSDAEIQRRVPEILKAVGLEDKAKFRPSQLSGGEQQRVGLARALVNQPKILIADEPTANIDGELSLEMMKLLKKFNADGTTVIVVTHNKQLVEHTGGRIIELEKGKIISDSKPPAEEADNAQISDTNDYDELIQQFRSDKDSDNGNTEDFTEDVSVYDELIERARKEMQ